MVRLALPFLVVSVLFFEGGTAFSPTRPSSSSRRVLQLTGTTTFLQKARVQHASKTSLNMGVMEDFLTGRDAAQRESENKKYLEELQKRVDRITELEATIEELGDDELEAKTKEFKERLAKGEDINGPLLEEAFAVVREAAWYVID